MVNTGKPSRGCKMCRARRIRCDERKPFCVRCEKSKRICPGYRDVFETKIRDETQSTINKFTTPRFMTEEELRRLHYLLQLRQQQRREQDDEHGEDGWRDYDEYQDLLPHQQSTPWPALGDIDISERDLEAFLNRLGTSLLVPVDQQASCYFLSDFVLIPSSGRGFGYHQFICGLLQRNKVLPSFESAYKAVSTLALARRPNCRSLQLQAHAFYSKALKEVNRALQDETEAKDDQTLGSVLLLAFYEILNSSQPDIDGYSTHLKGATMLLKARGTENQKTPEGIELFHLTRNLVLTVRQMPGAALHDYAWLMGQDPHHPRINSFLSQMSLDIYDIRQQTEELVRTPQNTKVVAALLKLLRSSQGLRTRMQKLPMPPRVEWTDGVNAPDDAASYNTALPGSIYIFDNLHIGLMYLTSWLGQLFLATSIFRQMAALFGPEAYKEKKGYSEIAEMVEDCIQSFISSVPYFLGWKGKDSYVASSSPCGSPIVDEDNPMRGGIGTMIQWPLFAFAASDLATADQHAFLNGRLQYLSELVLIKQAESLRQMARRTEPSTSIREDGRVRNSRTGKPSTVRSDSDSPVSTTSAT